ncbi:hypothetical protein FGRMN_6862 [Fusarium graminum]|nr:hypothetical protein FGRMN_6862 [Fusarium graminum]
MPTSDIIYPLHEFDDSPINRHMQHWTLRFDAVLDTQKLCEALTHLLSQGDWRKLGGRLQFNETGKIEVHAPRTYTQERPAFQFSEETFPMRTMDHPVAKNLPRARGKAELFAGNAEQFNPLTIGPEWGLDFNEHIRRKEPIIGVHIALFDDATLINLRWVHLVCDFMGIKALVLAWSMVLHGRYDDIPPFMGAYDDPFKNIGAVPPEEPYALAEMKLSPEGFKKTYDRFLEYVAAYPKSVRRMLVLPDAILQKIKKDFAGAHSSDRLEIIPKGALFNGQFVSDADILSAWAARLCCIILPATDRPVHIMGMYEARHCLPETFPQRKDKPDSSPVFVANATFSTSTNTTLQALRQQPLARTALLVRESVAKLTKAPQVHAQLHLLRESYSKDKNPVVFAAEDSFILVVSNFSKMGFFDSIDFSPAVVTPAAVGHGKSPGKIAWHQWTSLEHDHAQFRNMFQVGGKDGQDNTWMMALLPPEVWDLVEEHLAGLSAGEEPVQVRVPSKL